MFFKLGFENKKRKGFSLVEIMVVLFIFSVIVVTFYKTFTVGMGLIAQAKNRTGAVALGNEKMEIVRNLKYSDIGLESGIPIGSIKADEDVEVNGKKYHVKTFVQYVDDPFDDLTPTDSIPNDYKRVKITISWKNSDGTSNSIYFVSRFVPPGLETSSGDGVLAINVFDSASQAVSQANLHIVNNSLSPAVNFSVKTDNDGHLLEPGALASNQKYEITISKSGYETFSTFDPDPNVTGFTPKPELTHASVVSGALNTYNYVIDKISDLKVVTVDPQGNVLPNIDFDIKGGKIFGTNTDGSSHYNLDLKNQNTDTNGEKNYQAISPGAYTIIATTSGYTFVGFDPAVTNYSLPAGTSDTIKLKLASTSADGAFVKVFDSSNNSPISGATVTLKKTGDPDRIITTGADGFAFFPNDATPLASGTYQIEVVAPTYETYTNNVDINGLTDVSVGMTLS